MVKFLIQVLSEMWAEADHLLVGVGAAAQSLEMTAIRYLEEQFNLPSMSPNLLVNLDFNAAPPMGAEQQMNAVQQPPVHLWQTMGGPITWLLLLLNLRRRPPVGGGG